MAYKTINKKGFTIIEIMIAISVFSMAIMLVMAVVIGMGKQYQKASYTTQLNSASRSIHDEIAKDINYGSIVPSVQPPSSTDNLRWMCLSNNVMYAWYNSVDGNIQYGLFKGQSPNCTVSSLAPAEAEAVINSSGTNLLPANSFVKSIEINSAGGNTYTVKTDFRSGTQDMFAGNSISNECLPTLRGGDFCSVVQYNNSVRQRL